MPSDSDAARATSASAQPVSRDAPLPATISRFTIDGKLGAGAMGVVLLATDPMLGRNVALKLMREGTAHDEERRKRFIREAQAAAKVVHDNVIVVHEVGTHDGQVYVAMEYVPGQTLAGWQHQKGWREIVETYARAGRGLAAAHDAGLVHRDFKPDNVLIGDDGRVRVTDFGLVASTDAIAVDGPTSSPGLGASLTHTGSIMGTPRYMAPEQHRAQPVDARADQYAFCVALYEALFGRPPFAGATYAELAASVLGGKLDPPPSSSEVPRELRAAITRGLSLDRNDRHASMHDLLRVLREVAATPAPAPRRSRRTLALAAAGTSLVLASALAWKLSRSSGESPPPSPAPAPLVATPLDASTVARPDAMSRDLQHGKIEFDTAQEAYLAGKYDDAAARFMDAYRYYSRPEILYNVGAAYQMKGKKQRDPAAMREAVKMYRRYLAEVPNAPDRERVEKVIGVLEAEAARLSAPP